MVVVVWDIACDLRLGWCVGAIVIVGFWFWYGFCEVGWERCFWLFCYAGYCLFVWVDLLACLCLMLCLLHVGLVVLVRRVIGWLVYSLGCCWF